MAIPLTVVMWCPSYHRQYFFWYQFILIPTWRGKGAGQFRFVKTQFRNSKKPVYKRLIKLG